MSVRAQAGELPPPPQQQQLSTPGPAKLVGPEPKTFSIAKGQLFKVGAASFVFLARAGSGGFAYGYKAALVQDDGKYAVTTVRGKLLRETSTVDQLPRPAQTIVLYEFEGCPFCRKVREAVCILDLDVLFKPCPKGGSVWRQEAIKLGGKAQFPLMIDPNTKTQMYESDAIIQYLFTAYGPGADKVPLALRLGFLTALTCALALAPRMGAGIRALPSSVPPQPLEYWGYEMSPFCKLVREVLCELEIPHVQRTCARGSPKRQQLLDLRGHFQVPYIEDPNTGIAMFESKAIVEYLRKTYGKPAAAAGSS